MKKLLKRMITFALILALGLLCIPAQAVNAPADSRNILFESFDETTRTGKQLASIGNSVFYTMATPEFTYCAQMTQAGKVRFSYMDLRTGSITESIIHDKNFTAERSDATLLRNRPVTVTGYEGTQYWAGWIRKMYFFKGDLGWTHDANFHYDLQQSDYSDVLYLLDKGWQNFAAYTL